LVGENNFKSRFLPIITKRCGLLPEGQARYQLLEVLVGQKALVKVPPYNYKEAQFMVKRSGLVLRSKKSLKHSLKIRFNQDPMA